MDDVEDQVTEASHFPAEMENLPPKFEKKAQTELSENPQTQKNQIEEMRNLLNEEESINAEWFTDEDIILFLRGRKYSVENALASLKRTVNIIKKYADHFQEFDSDSMTRFLEKGSFLIMPRRNREGQLILVTKLGRWDPCAFPVDKALIYMNLILWHGAKYPMTQVNGAKVIFAFNMSVLKYIRYITPYNIYNMYQLLMECVPIRKKGAHIVNPNSVTKTFLSIYKAFLSPKLRSRVFVHSDSADLLTHVQADVVPTEYGGELRPEEQRKSLNMNISLPSFITNILHSLNSHC